MGSAPSLGSWLLGLNLAGSGIQLMIVRRFIEQNLSLFLSAVLKGMQKDI